ncbi:uncharacterized protein [Linepithema humile]|uniref:uncharacterized protein n=1 Tax=Linepithema humile TaxID=83485 RepID=UPI00351EEC0A
MYKVVEFDDGIMAVPTKWVDIKKSVCKWPPYKNNEIEEAIRDNEDVGRGWLELPIRACFGKAVDDLASAKEKVKLALIVSDCDDDEMLKRSRHERSRRRKVSSESNSEDDDNTTEVNEKNAPSANKKLLNKLPTNMSRIVQSSGEKMENTDTNENVSIFEQVFNPETHVVTQTAAKNSTGKCTNAKKQYGTTLDEKLNYIIRLLEENMKKNNAILADLGRMWKHIRDDEKKNEHEPNAKRQFEIANNINSFISLKDANDLDLLEEQLKTEDFKNAMVNINFIHCTVF